MAQDNASSTNWREGLPNTGSQAWPKDEPLGQAPTPELGAGNNTQGLNGNGPPSEADFKTFLTSKNYVLDIDRMARIIRPTQATDKPASKDCELFIGKIPKEINEADLFPIIEKHGQVVEFRIMMDFQNYNRGFAFVTFTEKADATKAIKALNNFEIKEGKFLGVCRSVDNRRLFVGGLLKSKNEDEILAEMKRIATGVVKVISYKSVMDKAKNRGFAFVEFETHKMAAMARRKLIESKPSLWGRPIAVDWAEPEIDIDDEIMSKVKNLYVRNLMNETTEETLEEVFAKITGKTSLERIKKIKDYAFLHFNSRENAEKCKTTLHGTKIDGSTIDIHWAKPVDKEAYTAYLNKKSADKQQKLAAKNFQNFQATNYLAPYSYFHPAPQLLLPMANASLAPATMQGTHGQAVPAAQAHHGGQGQGYGGHNSAHGAHASSAQNQGGAPGLIEPNYVIYEHQGQRYLSYMPLATQTGFPALVKQIPDTKQENGTGSNANNPHNKKRGAGGIRACGTRKYLNKKGNDSGSSTNSTGKTGNNTNLPSSPILAHHPQVFTPRFVPKNHSGYVPQFSEIVQSDRNVAMNAHGQDAAAGAGEDINSSNENLKRLPNTTTPEKKTSYLLNDQGQELAQPMAYEPNGLVGNGDMSATLMQPVIPAYGYNFNPTWGLQVPGEQQVVTTSAGNVSNETDFAMYPTYQE